MSTSYRFEPPLAWDEFWARRGELVPEINEVIGHPDATATERCLVCDGWFAWANRAPDGSVEFERYGANYGAREWLEGAAVAFDRTLLSEHDDGYWGPYTEEVDDDDAP